MEDAVPVMVDSWEDSPKLTKIYGSIFVERPGQKGILIGAKGAMLKRIGMLARGELELLLGRHVFLDLRVKVQPEWRENKAFLNTLDWRTTGE